MKRCVIVGTGHRGTQSYVRPLVTELKDCVKLCGVYDINPKRAAASLDYAGANDVKVYTDFDEMIKAEKPDTVIVTSKDCTHDKYVIRAMELGCDVVSEKPLTTDEVKFNNIYKCMEETGKNLVVTFNCRFDPMYVKMKEILKSGVIGDILSVHYEWLLDTSHGADYFRRWHRERANSGSLLIHKATHHFDLLNWFLEQDPVKVNAYGTQRFYGPHRENRGVTCRSCAHKTTCEFYFNAEADPFYQKIYLDCEDVDGYFRDGCVFSDDIDIEDSVSVNINYSGGTVVSYSLTAHSPYEGAKFVFNGSDGRLEATTCYDVLEGRSIREIKVYTRYSDVITYRFDKRGMVAKTNQMVGAPNTNDFYGGHNGSDPVMRSAIFRGAKADPMHQVADIKAAAMSIGIGIAANKSMKEDRAVYINELFDYLKA